MSTFFKTLILTVMITLCQLGIAQLENIPLITTIGESVIKVEPDHAVLGIRVERQINLKAGSNTTAFEIFRDIDTRINLFDFDQAQKTETLVQVDSNTYFKEVFFTIRDLDKVERYMIELYRLGFTSYVFLEYRVNNYAKTQLKAKQEAIQSAKEKAVKLASSLGQTIGKAHLIEEIPAESFNWYEIPQSTQIERLTYEEGSINYLIEPGYITINAQAKVSFDLIK